MLLYSFVSRAYLSVDSFSEFTRQLYTTYFFFVSERMRKITYMYKSTILEAYVYIHTKCANYNAMRSNNKIYIFYKVRNNSTPPFSVYLYIYLRISISLLGRLSAFSFRVLYRSFFHVCRVYH